MHGRISSLTVVALWLTGCATASSQSSVKPETASTAQPLESSAPAPAPKGETLTEDTPKTTAEGATFVAPAGWNFSVRGPVTVVAAPEGDSEVAFVDVHAANADEAVAQAWKAYKTAPPWPLELKSASPDAQGWSDTTGYVYKTSPNEKRIVSATATRAGEVWTVVIANFSIAVAEKRGAQLAVMFGRLRPKGYAPESFAGKKANTLDPAHLAKLSAWVEKSRQELKLTGVAIGLVQDGKVVFADGFGEKELGKPGKPDADTLFMIASNSKALTTLMLAKLVDQKKQRWDEKVTQVLPGFKLGDAETTAQVEVKHLICACTGLPRQDLEMIFEFGALDPQKTIELLGRVQPTSKFGEMFQYSNLLAAAGGYIGAHALYPRMELGPAFDEAMRTQVFAPLGMTATTFDYAKALKGNHALPESLDVDGKPAPTLMKMNDALIPVRPAGGAWSNVRDMLKYVSMELANGVLPNGKSYIGKEALLARREAQVSIGKDDVYGMGLMVNTRYGIPLVHHGGDVFGFHSDMIWLPENGVGAVVLTSGDPGAVLRSAFKRKLLEVLFDGRDEAEKQATVAAQSMFEAIAAERKQLTVPADPAEAAKLATHYRNEALGELNVSRRDGKTNFDFGEWGSDVATKKNPDGTVSFETVSPGALPAEFVAGQVAGKRTLILRDAQHEYVFIEQ